MRCVVVALGAWLAVAGSSGDSVVGSSGDSVAARGGGAAHQEDARFVRETVDYLERLESWGFAGVVLVARGGQPILARGFGLADRERGISWSLGTVSTVGSITKQFTAALILKLATEGLLSAEDPLEKHFEGVPGDKRGITLHHLLTHSSGIVDFEGVGDFDPIGREEYVRRALAEPLAFPPGEGYEYSNANYSLLGAIVEQLTGRPYEEALRERLLLPLGLYETGYLGPHWGEGQIAQGYRRGERWGTILERPMAADGPHWALRANGGIHATAYDMLRWAEALRLARALPAEEVERLWTPYVREGPEADTFYGYGWSVLDAEEGLRVVTHNGGNGIFFADLAIVPARELVIFLQTNVEADLPLIGGVLGRIGFRLVAGQPYPAVPRRLKTAPPGVAALAGPYDLAGGGRFEARWDGETLLLEPADRRAFALLLSTASPDLERAEALAERTGAAVAALLRGDVSALHEAHGGEVPMERLRDVWTRRLEDLRARHGELAGHQVLGAARRGERYFVVVRFLFEQGAEERAFVWSGGPEGRLLGISVSGLEPVARYSPVEGGGLASLDPRSGESRPLELERDASGDPCLVLGEEEEAVTARKARDR